MLTSVFTAMLSEPQNIFYPFVIKLLLTTIKRCFMRAGGFIVTNYYKTNWILSKLYFITIYIHFHVIHNNNITHSLTPHSTVLLEKLTGSAASQEIPRIFGTRRFLAVLTSVRHLSLSWANSIQSPQPPSTSWRSILILSSHLRLGLWERLLSSENSLPTCQMTGIHRLQVKSFVRVSNLTRQILSF